MLCFPFTALGEKGTEEMGLAPKTTEQRFPHLTIQQFNHGTLSPNHGRFCRIARLPHEGEAFAANRHAQKSPLMRGDYRGVRYVKPLIYPC